MIVCVQNVSLVGLFLLVIHASRVSRSRRLVEGSQIADEYVSNNYAMVYWEYNLFPFAPHFMYFEQGWQKKQISEKNLKIFCCRSFPDKIFSPKNEALKMFYIFHADFLLEKDQYEHTLKLFQNVFLELSKKLIANFSE